MERDEILDSLLKSFHQYYDINTDNPCNGFAAEAEFHSHTEQYVLVKAAHISDIDTNEYVYFARESRLTVTLLDELVKKAWDSGLAKVKPDFGHKSSDVSLFIIADTFEDGIIKKIKKTKLYKSYMLTFKGWSKFRLVAMETSSKTLAANSLGNDLKKIFKTII